MDYEQHYTDHLLHLTIEETDRFFEPFNLNDPNIPSHLYHNGHRYIREDIYAWVVQHIGEPGYLWQHEKSGLNRRLFRFKNKSDAMLFKLTHGGK